MLVEKVVVNESLDVKVGERVRDPEIDFDADFDCVEDGELVDERDFGDEWVAVGDNEMCVIDLESVRE